MLGEKTARDYMTRDVVTLAPEMDLRRAALVLLGRAISGSAVPVYYSSMISAQDRQGVIKAKGIFSEDGRAQIWISNDADHLLLQMTSHLKFGSLSLHLKSRKLLDTASEADSSHRGDHRALNNGRPPER